MKESLPNQTSWAQYNEKIEQLPPRENCVRGLELVLQHGAALDYGAGSLTDTKRILEEGFTTVTAVDFDPDSAARAARIDREQFQFVQTTFEDYAPIPESFDFINAQNSLSFIDKTEFDRVFRQLLASLKPGSIITANLFGEADEWNTDESNRSFLNKEDLLSYLNDFEIILFDEVEEDKETALGKMKHWHILAFIARKK